MRPTQLTMTAFGPYRDTETIDFAKLKEYGLFAVSGATGAGKTTIFDAICFALYGQASGEDRTDIRALRSDFAKSELQTAVELEFVIKQRTFRVFRQVPYTKEGNKTETSGRIEFFERTNEGEIPAVDRQMVSEVNKKIEELIGFTLAQFSQIVMLPQGEFRKFLTSDTENKETILRKIFKTEHYREMAEILKRKRDVSLSELNASRLSMEQITKQVPASLPERESELFRELQAESTHYTRLMNALQIEAAHYKKEADLSQKQYNTSYKAHEQAQKNLLSATSLNQQFEELAQKTKSLQTLVAKEPAVNMARTTLEKAEHAVQIEGSETRAAEAQVEVEKRQQNYKTAVVILDSVQEVARKVEQLYLEEEQKQPIRERNAKQLITLQTYLPSVTEIDTREQQIGRLKAQVESGQHSLREMKLAEEEKEKSVQQLLEKVEKLETAIEGYEQVLDTLAEVRKKEDLLTRFSQHSVLIQQLTSDFEEQKLRMVNSREQAEQLEANWLADQALRLAETLEDGSPCPVCGSTDHPVVQSATTENHITKEQLERAKSDAVKANEAYRSIELQLEIERKEIERIQQQTDAALNSEELSKTKVHVKEVEQQLLHMKKSREQLPNIKKQYKEMYDQLTRHRQAMGDQEKKDMEAISELKEARSVLEESIKSVPESYRTLQSLQNEIRMEEKNKIALEQAFEEARQQRQSALEDVTKAQTALEYMTKSVEESVEKQQIASAQFQAALTDSIFTNEEEYMQSKATKERRATLATAIQNYEVERKSTAQAIDELNKQLEGKQKADLLALQEFTSTEKKAYELALSEYHRTMELEKHATKLHIHLRELLEAQGGLEQQYGRYTELFDLVKGNNDRKLSFERYLQTEYLERILHAANGRLSELSNGQFQLLRSDRQESRGRQSGLGIDVYDEYTGQNRDVKTLSGGEKFNASLSLALGMADVIQSFQGSISVETMFIDEGFGSLDEESLQKAIDTLIGLQKEGRMIGVISHVAELKEAFPAVLRVEKTKEGHSYTRIQIQ